MASDQCVRAWEGAYRHYGHIWELTARTPKGDPAAAREMAAASRAVAAAWRQIETATTLPWWTVAALESAAAAFEEQAQKYDTSEKNESPSYERKYSGGRLGGGLSAWDGGPVGDPAAGVRWSWSFGMSR